MIAAAIVIFREVLEISLILGMIFAALNNLKSKYKIVFYSILGGASLSSILALSFSYISAMFDNTGQEILNILILSSSIIFINLTVIWINQHRKVIHHKITKNVEKALEQQISITTLVAFISLIIAREGVEVILFLKGISTYTESGDLLYGSLLGLSLGIATGAIVYSGLLKLHIKYFFKAINFLLVILVAGMGSQLANYLTSADIIMFSSEIAWDSSWLVDENSSFGKILYNTFGYSSNPTILQVIFYFTNIAVTSILLLITSQNSKKNK